MNNFDFLTGHFDVVNRVLTASGEWEEYAGTCTGRTHHDGAVSIDEARFPSKASYGMSLRLFDPASQEWTVYWVNSRTGKLQPPVRGSWSDGTCTLYGVDEVDGRRFRMNFGVEGLREHEEDEWLGRRVRIGEAVVVPNGNVGRCAVTTQNPDTGKPDLDTLKALAAYRREVETTEPLAFGIYAAVTEAGRVRVGDSVQLL